MARYGTALVAIACCLACPAARAETRQQTPATQKLPAREAARTLTLNVVVTVQGGNTPIAGLKAADFSVRDDKHPVPVLDFHAAISADSAPPSQQAIFVLDEVNTGFTQLSQARDQLLRYLRSVNGPLPVPVSILLLADTSAAMSGSPSRDGKQLAADLAKADTGLRTIHRSSQYGGADRIEISVRSLRGLLQREAAAPGRKLLVWISPGWPYLAYPGVTYSARQQQGNFGMVNSIWSGFADADLTLYSIDPLGTDNSGSFQTMYYRTALKPARDASDATLSNLGLQVLATQSGGLVFNSNNDISREIGECLQDASAYYAITVPMQSSEKPGVYHALSVAIDKPGYVARTRVGYYTQP